MTANKAMNIKLVLMTSALKHKVLPGQAATVQFRIYMCKHSIPAIVLVFHLIL